VQDEVTKTEKTPYIDPRMAAMDAISKQINGDPEADAPEPAVTTETDTQLAAQLSDEPKFLNDGLDQYRVKVKIDGQESDVSVADMQREYQKAGAADRRMADATRLQRENMELQERLQQQLQNIPAVPDVEDIDTANQYTTALFAGDEAEANKAFATAVKKAVQAAIGETGRSNTTQVDPVQIAQQVKQQMVADTALEQSRADYPQLYADPDIEALGATKIQRKIAEGKSFAEALTETGSEFAKSFNWTTAGRQNENATTTARDIKLDRKANIDNVRAINSKTTTTEAPPQSTTDVIAEMRKARGM
jgi:prophage antirepressor-like protein